MTSALEELLRCPHCGDRLATAERGKVLYDHCAAYPVLDGVVYLRTDEVGERALRSLRAGDDGEALTCLLAGARDPAPVARLLRGPTTFREAVAVLVPGPEGDHLLHRSCDPVFRASDHVFRAAATHLRPSGAVLDMGAGAGHLARGLAPQAASLVLADVSFAALWLAARYLVADAAAVCCDANRVLPFDSGRFDLVVSSDAFHYVWSRRLLAAELLRVRADDGVLVVSHLHNLLTYNPSAGMPLPPAGYRRLLGPGTRLLSEEEVLAAALDGTDLVLDGRSDEELRDVPALTALVSDAPLPCALPPPPRPAVAGHLAVNPLLVRVAGTSRWRLVLPSPGWAEEYADLARYLPDEVELPEEVLAAAAAGAGGAQVEALRARCVLLDLPDAYV